MFSNIRKQAPKITIGSLLGSVFTGFAFFGIDAKVLRDAMVTNYGWLLASLVFLVVAVFSAREWWRTSRVTASNIQGKLRGWLDRFNIVHGAVTWPPWTFGYQIAQQNVARLFIAQERTATDYLFFSARLIAIAPKYRPAFESLTPGKKTEFFTQLYLETARAKTALYTDESMTNVSVEKWLPITPRMKDSDFLTALNDFDFSIRVVYTTIDLYLGRQPSLKPPSSTPDTGALPPSEAS
jgi:hypothetical protein